MGENMFQIKARDLELGVFPVTRCPVPRLLGAVPLRAPVEDEALAGTVERPCAHPRMRTQVGSHQLQGQNTVM